MPTTTPPAPQPLTRNAVRRALAAAGLPSGDVVAHRAGAVSIKFEDANRASFYTTGIDPVGVWIERVTAAVPGVEVVNSYESVAEWRPAVPVLAVTVVIAPAARTQNAQATFAAQAS